MESLKAQVLDRCFSQSMQAHCLMSSELHLPTVHCYADDSQLYISFSLKAQSGEADAVASIDLLHSRHKAVDVLRQLFTYERF